MEQWVVWLALIIVLTFIEITTVNLVTIWFVLSAIVSLIVSFLTDNYLIQFGIFVILGVILLITTKPLIKKTLKPKKEATNLDRVIGLEGIVTEDITKNNCGEVKVDGKKWTAYADEEIKTNENIKVLEINGVKLKVMKAKEE